MEIKTNGEDLVKAYKIAVRNWQYTMQEFDKEGIIKAAVGDKIEEAYLTTLAISLAALDHVKLGILRALALSIGKDAAIKKLEDDFLDLREKLHKVNSDYDKDILKKVIEESNK